MGQNHGGHGKAFYQAFLKGLSWTKIDIWPGCGPHVLASKKKTGAQIADARQSRLHTPLAPSVAMCKNQSPFAVGLWLYSIARRQAGGRKLQVH